MLVEFEELSEQAQIWIYPVSSSLSGVESFREDISSFIRTWTSHGTMVKGGFNIVEKMILIVGAEQSPSGCSIDKLTHKLQELGNKYNHDFFNRLNIFYENQGQTAMVDFRDKEAILDDKDLKIYDLSITRKADLKSKFLLPFSESWVSNLP